MKLRGDSDAHPPPGSIRAFIIVLTATALVAFFMLALVLRLPGIQALVVSCAGVFTLASLACPFLAVGGPTGFRNPWVYASRRSWIISQRVVAVGGAVLWPLIAVAALRDAATGLVALILGAFVFATAACAVSWVVWRNDPSRRPL
jgi:hypothetical protein